MSNTLIVPGHWRSLIDSGAQYQWLAEGRRLHLQHGPIDLIVEAVGTSDTVKLAFQQAHACFQNVLPDLVVELAGLRTPLTTSLFKPQGRVAQRMVEAAAPYVGEGDICKDISSDGCTNTGEVEFLTPMISVAGSVADHVLQAMCLNNTCRNNTSHNNTSRNNTLKRAYVNNGGDIALWLAPDEKFTVGICENTRTGAIGSRILIQARHQIGGIATSGWQGRSHSLGIADAVTVLANDAAAADAAATIIANAVDLPGSPLIRRTPAVELSPDSDLGQRLVTVAVDALGLPHIDRALNSGWRRATQLLSSGRIKSAYISLQGHHRVCGKPLNSLRAGVMHA